MREISAEAGVAQALLHYHFKNKDSLYREVFNRRATVISAHRRQQLTALLKSDQPASLESVLKIIAAPLPDIFAGAGQDTQHYLQMVAEVTVATDERSVDIVDAFYDPIAKEMIAAFARVLPELSQETAKWAYLFAIGARLQAHAHNHRAARLSQPNQQNRPLSPHALLVPFLAAGIRAMAGPTDGQTSGDRVSPARRGGSRAEG